MSIMTTLIPPMTPLPPTQSTGQPHGAGNQAPTAVQAAAAVTALPVGNQTRMAANAAGNNAGSAGARGEKGKKTDSGAAANETKSNRGARPRGMGGKADLNV